MLGAIKKIKPSLILFAVILFHLVNTSFWLKIDKSYIKLDAWGHYRYSLEVYDFLKSILHFNLPLSAVEPMRWHGLLVGFTTAPFYFIFGRAQDAAIMINSAIFLTILVLSTYGIGKKLLNKQAGLLAVFILTLYPIIFNNLRIYMLDLPLTSMVVLSLYFLMVSDNFTDRKNSLLFGLSLGLGLLVKFNYGAFILGPFILTCYRAVRQNPVLSKKSKKNILYFMIIAVFLCAIFYILRAKDMLNRIYEISNLGIIKDYSFTFLGFISWRLSWILKYIEILISQGISFLFLIVFIMGFSHFIKLALKDRWLIYLTLIIPLFIQIFLFSIPPECMVRYCIPFLPMIAIISAVGILSIKNRTFKTAFILFLIVLGIIQFFAVSYGIPIFPNRIKFTFNKKPYNFDLVVFEQNIGVPPFLKDKSSHPSTADWKSSQVLNAIISSNVFKERIKVLSLNYIPEIFEAMDYQILIKRELIDLMPATVMLIEKFYKNRHAPLDMMCITSDYIITSDNIGSIWESTFNSNPKCKEEIEKARTIFYQNINRFKLIETFRLPDGSNLFIYKNIYKPGLIKSQEINYGDIKFLFDNGRGRIFYKNTEITKGLGLYVSLFSLQHWRDSMEATWEVKKLSETNLIAKGRWMFIPVSQTWEIELKEGNVIDWRVKMDVQDTIKIEIEDFKLMLSDNYKSWFVSDGTKGTFLDIFEESRWKKFWVGSVKNKVGVNSVNIENAYLPSVIFHAYRDPSLYIASIENSDQLFEGRVIGCSKKNVLTKKIFTPGKYKYFSARIYIK